MTEETNQRFKRILVAYKDAIGDRDRPTSTSLIYCPRFSKAEALREYVASRGGPVKDNESDGSA